jgi:hypothetical protein
VESGFAESLESGGRFCVGEFGRNLASVAVMFSHLIYFIQKFYECCNFNMICEDNAAINCITVQHKKVSFPSILTGHALGQWFSKCGARPPGGTQEILKRGTRGTKRF